MRLLPDKLKLQFCKRPARQGTLLTVNWRQFNRCALLFNETLLIVLCCLGMNVSRGLAQEQPQKDQTVPLERRPYEVRILIGFDGNSSEPATKRLLLREIDQTVRRCVGGLWSTKTNEATWLNPIGPAGLRRLDPAILTAHYPDESVDIWFVVGIESLATGTRVSVRAWQPEVQSQSAVVSTQLHDLRELPVNVIRICRDLMKPMGIVESVNKQSVVCRLRAGELTPQDPSFTQLKNNDLLLPVLASRNKKNVVDRLQSIPWTYVTVTEVDGPNFKGTVQSGMKLGLGGKKRGRIETLVIALRPEHTSTQIQLLSQTKPKRPLVAHRIEVRTSNLVAQPKADEPAVGVDSTLLTDQLTDRQGFTRIPIHRNHQLVWLFAYSGENLLARVPCIPGIAETMQLEVPDDSARLTAESDLQMLQGEVIDAVALRNTAISTIRAASIKDDWKTVNQKLDVLKRQQDDGSLNERLIAVRVAGIAAAKARRDRVSEVRINRICDDTAVLIAAHLGSDKLRLLTEEMASLQKADSISKKNEATSSEREPE